MSVSVAALNRKSQIGTEYSVNEQFPKAIEDRRKVLYPIAKNARRNESNKVRLVHDKLYINGQLHIPDGSLTQQKQSQQNPARRGFRNPPTSYQQNRGAQTFIGQRFSARPGFQNGVRQNSPNRFGRARGQERSLPHTSAWGSDIQTSNPFAPLCNENGTQDNDKLCTPQAAGKQKASSPIDNEQTLKKQREFTHCENTQFIEGCNY